MKAIEIMNIQPFTARPEDTFHDLLWSFTKSDHHNIYVKDDNNLKYWNIHHKEF